MFERVAKTKTLALLLAARYRGGRGTRPPERPTGSESPPRCEERGQAQRERSDRQPEGGGGGGSRRSAGRQGRAERVRSGRVATPEGATPLPDEHAELPDNGGARAERRERGGAESPPQTATAYRLRAQARLTPQRPTQRRAARERPQGATAHRRR